jgi:SAM-dependent methyltransferase
MRVPESGMPDEAYWESLFDVGGVLDRLELGRAIGDAVELGCGYGTFTIPVAQRISGTVFTFDIDPAMIARTRARAAAAGVRNLKAEVRDVLSGGFGLPDASCDVGLLFNILHCAEPESLLTEAARVVGPAGRVLVMHWRSDIETPRGPPLAIRPRPEQVAVWATAVGLAVEGVSIDLPPWHFGQVLKRA